MQLHLVGLISHNRIRLAISSGCAALHTDANNISNLPSVSIGSSALPRNHDGPNRVPAKTELVGTLAIRLKTLLEESSPLVAD